MFAKKQTKNKYLYILYNEVASKICKTNFFLYYLIDLIAV